MAKPPSNNLQLTLFPPESAWRPPALSALPQDWTQKKRIALDTETRDDFLREMGCGARRGAYIVGYSFAPEGEKAWYVPMRHLDGDNVEDPDKALEYLRYQAANYEGEIVGAKLDYDLDMLAQEGIVFRKARFLDVQVAEPLIDELQYSYSLDSILERHELELKDEGLLRQAATAYGLDPKKGLWKLPARYVGPYAEGDVERPLELLRKQEAIIERSGLQRIWELEQKVLPILVKMRRRGVRVNENQLEKMERWSLAEEAKAWGEVLRHSGVNIRVGDAMKAEVVAQALRAVEIYPPTTAKTGKPSIDKNWLEAQKHPVASGIRRARKMSQLRSTFCDSVRRHTIRGRIHCTFNQIKMQKDDGGDANGAAYGRLSSSDPNLQQQPARDPEIGPEWRSVYIPEEGAEWGSLDYSQQEPRLAVHTAIISGERRIGHKAHASALAAAQRYWDDRDTDAHTMFVQMVDGDDVVNTSGFKHRRTILKNTYLGVCYGMGEVKLCRELGYPTKYIPDRWNPGAMREVAGDEGRALLDLVDEKVPYVRATAKAVETAAKSKGYVITIMGRHCHFPKSDKGYDWTHKAFNRVIQGGAADQTKTAMIALDEAGAFLQLQVHDEFDISLSSREEGQRYAEIMEHCVELKVPSKVDLEIGPSWGEIK